MKCPHCDMDLNEDAKECEYCSYVLPPKLTPQQIAQQMGRGAAPSPQPQQKPSAAQQPVKPAQPQTQRQQPAPQQAQTQRQQPQPVGGAPAQTVRRNVANEHANAMPPVSLGLPFLVSVIAATVLSMGFSQNFPSMEGPEVFKWVAIKVAVFHTIFKTSLNFVPSILIAAIVNLLIPTVVLIVVKKRFGFRILTSIAFVWLGSIFSVIGVTLADAKFLALKDTQISKLWATWLEGNALINSSFMFGLVANWLGIFCLTFGLFLFLKAVLAHIKHFSMRNKYKYTNAAPAVMAGTSVRTQANAAGAQGTARQQAPAANPGSARSNVQPQSSRTQQ